MSTIKLFFTYFFVFTSFEIYSAFPMISKITYKFMVKWPLYQRDFANPYNYSDFPDCTYHRKSLIMLNETDNLSFYLALGSYWHGFFISIQSNSREGDISESVYLDYAFVVSKNRLLYLARTEDLQVKVDELSYENFKAQENDLFYDGIAIAHCMISVYTEVNVLPISPDFVRLSSATYEVKKSIVRTDFCKLWRNGAKRDYLMEYLYSGKIPEMNVERATEMLKNRMKLHVLHISELGVLSLEYMKSHLTVDNVAGILQFSKEQGFSDLEDKCMEFLARKYNLDP